MGLQLLRNILTRAFILGFLSQFTFMITFHILIPTLPIYLSRLGSSEREIGVLIGAFAVSSLVLRPLVGRALLTYSEKAIMMAGAFLFTVTFATFLVAPPFWPLLIVRIFQGIGFAFFNTASFALIVNISTEEHRGQSLSYFMVAPNISMALAPSVGMAIVNRFDFTFLFIVGVGLSLCTLVIIQRLRRTEVLPSKDPPVEDRFFLNAKALPSSGVVLLHNICWSAMTAFFPLYAVKKGVTNPGFFFSALAMMMILGRALGGRILDVYQKEKIILIFLTTVIVAMTILTFSKTLPMFILVGLLWGTAAAFLIPAFMTYTLDRAGSSRGTAIGTYTTMADLGIALGPVIMGMIIHATSYQTMFLCLILTEVINIMYFYFFVRRRA